MGKDLLTQRRQSKMIAIITQEEKLFSDTIGITKVDGKKLGKLRGGPTIEVLPGEHTLEVNLTPETFLPLGILASKMYRKTISFMAEAGHVYIVRGKVEARGARWIWIEDKETNEVVGGEKPEEPEE
jgi:hypothetical protein